MTGTGNHAASEWIAALTWDSIPADLIKDAKLRILDTLGVALAASASDYGEVMRRFVLDAGGVGPCRVIGAHATTSAAWAALANGGQAHALIFDDTHNASIVHPTSPVLAATLAVGEQVAASGRDLLIALIGGTEIACRVGLAAEGAFHAAGFQPTAIAAPFGCAYAAGRLLGLDAGQLAHAGGIVGSMAAGINESWADGSWAQLLHPGWAAHSGITAAMLARSGYSGPSSVFEGRFGIFRTHVQRDGFVVDHARITRGLGTHWEGRSISYKPYPCAHVIHPFLDAILEMRRGGLRPEDVVRVTCPIAEYMERIVCAPVEEKRRPVTDAQARTSLPYSLAEALCLGHLDASSYRAESLLDPCIQAMADRIDYVIDADAPDTRAYKGWVVVDTRDGRKLEIIIPNTRGSAENPMSEAEILAKFHSNAGLRLDSTRITTIVQAVHELERHPVSYMTWLCVSQT